MSNNSCPIMPWALPNVVAVGECLRTNVCPLNRKWDIQIINLFITTKRIIYNLTNFLPNEIIQVNDTERSFVVWEQHTQMCGSSVHISTRSAFIDLMNEHHMTIYREPDIKAMMKNLLQTLANVDVIFLSSEAYRLLEPVHHSGNGKACRTFDTVPLIEVKDIPGIRVWGGINHG